VWHGRQVTGWHIKVLGAGNEPHRAAYDEEHLIVLAMDACGGLWLPCGSEPSMRQARWPV
jgi:hypothetical protein